MVKLMPKAETKGVCKDSMLVKLHRLCLLHWQTGVLVLYVLGRIFYDLIRSVVATYRALHEEVLSSITGPG